MAEESKPWSGHAPDLVRDNQLMHDRIAEQDREIERLRAALTGAVEVIKTWHNMSRIGLRGDPTLEAVWDIYWRCAPEMKSIREALAAVETDDDGCSACGHATRYHFDDGAGNVVCRASSDCECCHRAESIPAVETTPKYGTCAVCGGVGGAHFTYCKDSPLKAAARQRQD